jgi:hypothetical protein
LFDGLLARDLSPRQLLPLALALTLALALALTSPAFAFVGGRQVRLVL